MDAGERAICDLLPPDWEYVGDAVLCCPHGHYIELDGECLDGCVSPLKTMGLM